MQIPCHKEVISGTTYDTATAALVGWVHDDEVDSDDEAIRQYLMRNVDGRFFLLHDLGSLTRRASLRINSRDFRSSVALVRNTWCRQRYDGTFFCEECPGS
jgi:hypothetical protein